MISRYDSVPASVTRERQCGPRRVEVLTGPERRRKWPDGVKIAIVAEAFAKDVVVSEVARRHDIAHSQLFGWMRRFAASAFRASRGLDWSCVNMRRVRAPQATL